MNKAFWKFTLTLIITVLAAGSMAVGSFAADGTADEPTATEHIHVEESIPAIPATCTQSGMTEGKKCSSCGEVIAAPAEEAALGHDVSGEFTVDVPATCVSEGTKSKHCKREGCDYKEETTVYSGGEHLITDGLCEYCNTYFVEVGKTVKVKLEEKGFRLTGVKWTQSGDSKVEDYGSEGSLSETTYYAIVKGIRAGEATVYAYSGGLNSEIIQRSKVIIECKNHSFTEYVSDGNATCEDGTKTAVCDFCDVKDTVIDEGSAVHSYGDYISNNDATCTADGTKTAICTECKHENTVLDENSKIPHDFQNYVSDNNAACTVDGTKTGACSVCGEKNTVNEEKSALGHLFMNYVSDGNADCVNDGTVTGKCSRCDETDTKNDPNSRLGHNYSTWVTIAEAACEEDGQRSCTCRRCNDTKLEVIPATGHSWVYQAEVEATCKEEGKTSAMYCSTCDKGVHSETIPKEDHDYNESIDHATLESNGTYMVTCEVCDSIFTVETIYRPKTIKLDETAFIYDGKTKTPKLTVKDVNKKDLVEGTDYTVAIDSGRKEVGQYSVKITFKGKYKGTKTLAFTIGPNKTSKITAAETADTITLKWNTVKYATGYRIYLYNSKTGKYEKVKTLTGTSYTIKKLKAGTKYKYAVRAYTKENGITIWAPEYETIITSTKPATLSVKVTAGSKKATLKWNKVTGATGYQVYMQAPGEKFKRVEVTKNNSYTQTGLKKGQTYKFRVRAYIKVDGKYVYGEYKTYSVKIK